MISKKIRFADLRQTKPKSAGGFCCDIGLDDDCKSWAESIQSSKQAAPALKSWADDCLKASVFPGAKRVTCRVQGNIYAPSSQINLKTPPVPFEFSKISSHPQPQINLKTPPVPFEFSKISSHPQPQKILKTPPVPFEFSKISSHPQPQINLKTPPVPFEFSKISSHPQPQINLKTPPVPIEFSKISSLQWSTTKAKAPQT